MALAASNLDICSGVRLQPTALRFCLSCSSLQRANDNRCNARSLKQPVQCDLRDRFICLGRHFVQTIDYAKEVFVIRLRTGVRGNVRVQAALFRSRLDHAGFSRLIVPNRADSDHRADLLV